MSRFFYTFENQTLKPTLMKDQNRRRRILLAILLILSIGNYTRIVGTDNIRTVEFLSIAAIGAITALLIKEVVSAFKNKE